MKLQLLNRPHIFWIILVFNLDMRIYCYEKFLKLLSSFLLWQGAHHCTGQLFVETLRHALCWCKQAAWKI